MYVLHTFCLDVVLPGNAIENSVFWEGIVQSAKFSPIDDEHKRRIKTEEKAKVVASAWEEECIQFLASLAVLPMTILKKTLSQMSGVFPR